jgi:hypothetical protein
MNNAIIFRWINDYVQHENAKVAGSMVASYSRVLLILGYLIFGVGLGLSSWFVVSGQDDVLVLLLVLGLFEVIGLGLLVVYYTVSYTMDDNGFKHRNFMGKVKYYRYEDGVVVKSVPTATYVKFGQQTFELSLYLLNHQALVERITQATGE